MKVYVVLDVYDCVETHSELIEGVYLSEEVAEKICKDYNDSKKDLYYTYHCATYEVM